MKSLTESSDAGVTTRLRIPYQDALVRIQQQVIEGERLHPVDEGTDDALEMLRAEAKIWADGVREVLSQAFVAPFVQSEFTQEMQSSMQSGTIREWIRNEKRCIFRGVTFLKSLEKRLTLSRTVTRNKSASKIPFPVMAVVADVLAAKYTHAKLDFLMKKAGVIAETPPEAGKNKIDRARDWLELANTQGEPLSPFFFLHLLIAASF